MYLNVASLDGPVCLDPDGPVDREAAGPEGAPLGQLEPEALEPRGPSLALAGVAPVEGVARCHIAHFDQNIVQYSAAR